MKKIIVGIDPGKSGGIAWINNAVYAAEMPDGTARLQEFLQELKKQGEPFVFLEKINAFVSDSDNRGKNIQIGKLLEQASMIQTILKVENIPFVLVPAITWQSNLNLVRRSKKGEPKESNTDKKNRHKELAQKYYPKIKVKHKTADALLIMTFGKIKWDTDTKWIRDRMPKPIANRLF